MKFIVDAQLPKSLADLLNLLGYDSIHTLDLPSKNSTHDSTITALAIKEDRVVISKDSDFLQSYLLKSEPKKLVMVKTGNIHNQLLLKLFEDNIKTITNLLSNSNMIEIGRTKITEHT